MINIIIGGDICPMGRVQNLFIEGKANEIFNDLLKEIDSADLSIVNLECPLISQESPIVKAGPVLGADRRCIQGFVASKWNVLNLANNHSFDHGAMGLLETINTIKKADLKFVGAGLNINEARLPYIAEIKGKRIIIYSMAEREFSIADEKTPGANPLDVINFINAIELFKQDGIFIVFIHGGQENYLYPSPEMVRRCHFMIERGADAIICCHTHCPLPWEIYNDKPIIYGLGNLIFEAEGVAPDSWYKGYLAKLSIEERQVHFEAIPYLQSKECLGAKGMNEKERTIFTNEMQKKNVEIRNNEFLSYLWVEYCKQKKETYISGLYDYNKLVRIIKRILPSALSSKKAELKALHLVQCEIHQEILNTIFKILRQEE